MVAKGLTPDVITYSTLIGKADFASGRDLLREMVAKGLTPNVITYSTLLKKVPNYAQAQNVLKEMKDAGLKPDLITYSTLLSKTTDFSQGRDVVKQMKDAGIEPDEIIYSKLFSKNPRYATAQEILDWFDAQRFHSLKPLNKLIESFHRARRFQDVLKITRLYPHLEASHRLRTMTFRRDDGVKP
jgi:pentatricopeptide repeat protein